MGGFARMCMLSQRSEKMLLWRQVREAAAAAGVLMAGENALPCFSPGHVDTVALERIVYNTQAWAPPLQVYIHCYAAPFCMSHKLPSYIFLLSLNSGMSEQSERSTLPLGAAAFVCERERTLRVV